MTELLRTDGDDGVCMMPRCSETDLLPTMCGNCKRRFCTTHIAPAAHNCTEYKRTEARALECPLCHQPVAVRPGESPDLAVSRHIDLGCTPVAAQSAAENRLNMCSFGDCRRNEVQRVVCEFCRQTYCIEHRHPRKHNCRAKPVTPPPAAATSPSTNVATSSPPVTGTADGKKKAAAGFIVADPRNDPGTAMQLPPSTAKGLGEGHVLVAVHAFLALQPGKKPRTQRPAYLSVAPTAPVGRVLDGICRLMDLPNENHVARNDDEKLWLHTLPLGMPEEVPAVCLPPSMTVKDCLESFGVGLLPGSSAVPAVILVKGTSLPREVVAALEESRGGGASPPSPSQQRPAAAGGGAAAKPKKKDDGCVVV